MRGAQSLPVTSAAIADMVPSDSMPSVSLTAASPIASNSSISSRSILPISIVVSIISGLLLLMRPAAHYVESVAGPIRTDIV